MLYFAYGSNMDRGIMRKYAPCAEPIGVASLAAYRFIITADGYASVEPTRAHTVHGVLWRLTPRDRVTLDAWENVACGHYSAATLAVISGGRRRPVLVYVARRQRHGRPKRGYMELVLAAAEQWHLPGAYVACLQRWLPARTIGGATRRLECEQN